MNTATASGSLSAASSSDPREWHRKLTSSVDSRMPLAKIWRRGKYARKHARRSAQHLNQCCERRHGRSHAPPTFLQSIPSTTFKARQHPQRSMLSRKKKKCQCFFFCSVLGRQNEENQRSATLPWRFPLTAPPKSLAKRSCFSPLVHEKNKASLQQHAE